MNDAVAFDLSQFFQEAGVATDDQAQVETCLVNGLAHYYCHITMDEPLETVRSLLSSRMAVPFIFGFGALAAVRCKTLSVETRQAMVRYALHQIDPVETNGIPFGLPVLVSYLAQTGKLDNHTFRSTLLIAVSDRRNVFDALQRDEMLTLVEWLIHSTLPQAEQVWWFQFLATQFDKYHLGQPFIDHVLHHSYLSDRFKQTICEAWLSPGEAGDPPLAATVLNAPIQGEEALMGVLMGQAGLFSSSPTNSVRSPFAGSDQTNLLSMIPQYVKKRAIQGLVESGADPLTVCQTYLTIEVGYDADAIYKGIAHIIADYGDRIPTNELRLIINRILEVGHVQVRQIFYQLGYERLGEDYRERARQDKAQSIQQWATELGE